MFGWHFTDLRFSIDSRQGRVGMAFPASIELRFHNCFKFCEISDIIYRKGENLLQKGKNLKVMTKNLKVITKNLKVMTKNFKVIAHTLTVIGQNLQVMRKNLQVMRNIRQEKGKNLTEISKNLNLISNLRQANSNILSDTFQRILNAGSSFSIDLFILAIHPKRVLYRCQPGIQVLKTITSARLASPILVNDLIINKKFLP
jgi:hypothetical protein